MNIFETANQYLAWNQHLAGWAQFFGAMIAIGITAWVALAPIRAERDAKRLERTAFVDAVGDAMKIQLDALAPLRQVASDHLMNWSRLVTAVRSLDRDANRTVSRILEVPLDRWPSAALYARTDSLVRACEHFIQQCNYYSNGLRETGQYGGPTPIPVEGWLDFAAEEQKLAEREAYFLKLQRRLLRD